MSSFLLKFGSSYKCSKLQYPNNKALSSIYRRPSVWLYHHFVIKYYSTHRLRWRSTVIISTIQFRWNIHDAICEIDTGAPVMKVSHDTFRIKAKCNVPHTTTSRCMPGTCFQQLGCNFFLDAASFMRFSVEKIWPYPSQGPASTNEQHSLFLRVHFLEQNVFAKLSCTFTEILHIE
jgi:hypothetical protein